MGEHKLKDRAIDLSGIGQEEKAPKNNCAICKFIYLGQPDKELKRQMRCRRFPPQVSILVTPSGPMEFTYFPLVNAVQTCGEWQPALLGMADA